jgi:hypothetical protein
MTQRAIGSADARRGATELTVAAPAAADMAIGLDAWVIAPHTPARRKRGRGPHWRTEAMTQHLVDLIEQFCGYQRKQRGRTEGGVKTYRWNLEQFLQFIRAREGRLARVADLRRSTIQAWLDDMAASDLGLNTLRSRLSTLSSFCMWLVKRDVLTTNPVAGIDRPPEHREPPAVPAPALMDALVEAAKRRGRPRDLAIFLVSGSPGCGAAPWPASGCAIWTASGASGGYR